MLSANPIQNALGFLLLNVCTAQTTSEIDNVQISDPLLKETSGLAVSRKDGNFLWAINDSGAAAQIHLLDQTGEARGVLRLKEIKNRDWEDLASFREGGKSYLLVADIGDNAAKRETVSLHLLEEPVLPEVGVNLDLEVRPIWSMTFNYEDGPRDCESVAVDVRGKSILLLSKRESPTALYQLPLRKPKAGEVMTAKRLGPTTKLPLPKLSIPHPHFSQPTGMDLSSDGTSMAVLTYRAVFLFNRKAGQSWVETFQEKPTMLGAHALPQAEALAFDPSGKFVYFTTEGRSPKLLRWPVK